MAKKQYDWWVMDGRARFDTDRALVLNWADSLKEAKRSAPSYGDAVVVRHDSDTNECVVVWTPEMEAPQ